MGPVLHVTSSDAIGIDGRVARGDKDGVGAVSRVPCCAHESHLRAPPTGFPREYPGGPPGGGDGDVRRQVSRAPRSRLHETPRKGGGQGVGVNATRPREPRRSTVRRITVVFPEPLGPAISTRWGPCAGSPEVRSWGRCGLCVGCGPMVACKCSMCRCMRFISWADMASCHPAKSRSHAVMGLSRSVIADRDGRASRALSWGIVATGARCRFVADPSARTPLFRSCAVPREEARPPPIYPIPYALRPRAMRDYDARCRSAGSLDRGPPPRARAPGPRGSAGDPGDRCGRSRDCRADPG